MASVTVNPPPHVVRTLPSTSKPLAAWRSYFPCPIAGLTPPPPPPTWCFCEFSCLFVCLALSLCWLRCLCLRPAYTQMFSSVSIFSVSHTQTHTNPCFLKLSFISPTLISCSDDAGRLIHWLLVTWLIPVQFSGTGLMSAQLWDWRFLINCGVVRPNWTPVRVDL